MKPTTKQEKEVVELSRKLPRITKAQSAWAFRSCFKKEVYNKGCGEMWCSECGKAWVDPLNPRPEGEVICPYCHEKLQAKRSRKEKEKLMAYMTIATTEGNWQVLRHFLVAKTRMRLNGGEIWKDITEVCQQWISEKAKVINLARPMNMYSRGWILNQPISIKKGGYSSYNFYDIDGYVYPRTKFLPILRRNGMKTSFYNITPSWLIQAVLKDSIAETLLKTRQLSLLSLRVDFGGSKDLFPIAKICIRNHYRIKDAKIWADYIELCREFGFDVHNAKYACPKNLMKAHDELFKRKEEKMKRERLERAAAAARRESDRLKAGIHTFYQKIQPFIGLAIHEGGLDIRPLESVTQYYKEGKAMHHCVYANAYFGKKDCLILSATMGGKRIETVELNTKVWRVEQSRAACNGQSEYHAQIVEAVLKNVPMFRRRIA